MKKNIIIAAIAAASALLLCASCQKQELIEQNNGNASGKTFTATIEQSLTKTTITSEYKVNWVEGDQIDINGGTTYSATPDADATKATFTKVSGSDPTPDYTAVYPASLFKNSGYELPATQTYVAGKFNAPMCAMSSTETLEFKNFCGVLCFALKGTDNVKSIAVTANEQLCGPFEFADATSIIFGDKNKGYTVTLDCGEGVQLDASTATNFYVYLPPKDSYTAGMKIVVTSTEGKTFEKTTTTAVKIERNNLYTFDWTASFSPATTGTAKRTGDIDVNWVQLWEGGPKFAEYNVGASSATDYGHYLAWGGSSDKDATYNAGSADLSGSDDSAYKVWGKHWRMPTKDELQALIDNCKVQWTNSYNGTGKAGTIYTGKGDYASNSIFLPAAGFHSSRDGKVNNQGFYGSYWSSTPNGSDKAVSLDFTSNSPQMSTNRTRDYGCSVRPIYVKDLVAVTSVKLNKTTLKVGVGNTETLSATVNPAATNKKVSWTSSKTSVATVDAYGNVTGVASGKCNITATTEDGNKTATCAVEVVVLTTGTAKAKINGKDVDVNWVQLWENGPKFAEKNVGASSATDVGSTMTFTNATKAGVDYVWGANWCTPSQDQMDELLKAATSEGSKKVKCEFTQENSVWGFKFTGLTDGYTSNAVFFPAQVVESGRNKGNYWSATASGSSTARYMGLFRGNTKWSSTWTSAKQSESYLVRPVLAK